MDFSSRNTHRPASRPVVAPVTNPKPEEIKRVVKNDRRFRGILFLYGALLVSALVLSIAAIASIAFRSDESSYVDTKQYQVITLLDKQAYFGKITKITDKYIVLRDIYYIQDNSTADKNAQATLVKRGCEIHKPQDQMIIYRQQVDFWENLQSSGRVAELIAQTKKDGVDCNKQAAASTEQNSDANKTDTTKTDDKTSATQPTTGPNATTTPKTTN